MWGVPKIQEGRTMSLHRICAENEDKIEHIASMIVDFIKCEEHSDMVKKEGTFVRHLQCHKEHKSEESENCHTQSPWH